MALDSIHNGRGFFSDYWLGSILSARKGHAVRFTPAQIRKRLARLMQLRQRVDRPDSIPLTDFRERFARPLLSEIMGFGMLDAEEDTRMRELVSEGGDTSAPLAIVLLEPDSTEVAQRGVRGKLDKALLDRGIPYGFILTSEVIRLIRRPGDGHKNAYFDFSIAAAVESEDVESLSAACSIMGAQSFAPDVEGHTPIERMEQESRKHSARVSEDLKQAVFSSAESLIRGFLADIAEQPDRFQPKPELTALRDAALLCLYRLLFIFYAESRDERLQTHSLYLENYSLERLVDRLLRLKPEEIAANRFAYWGQLRALFRIYDQGLDVGNLPGLQNIPPRGGTLFSFETPEGRFLAATRLPDRLVARVLLSLAATRPRRGVGRERVSFRELAIEQLGAVYEGLLEYEPRVTQSTMIEVKVQGREYVLAPADVCRLCEQKSLQVRGLAEIVAGTEAGILYPQFTEAEETTEETDEEGEETAEDAEDAEGGEDEDNGVKKGAPALLVRRLEPGDFYFVPSSARKASGSFYTREEIVDYLVRHALCDLADGKAPAEIEALRVIDPACGSGHFLIGAARYLGRQLHAAYRRELEDAPPTDFYPNRDLTPKVREEWDKEGEAWCKRRIVEKCLFGVDLNPTAVQLAQVALWIESLAGDRPLSFFAHHVRPGNSLLGTWLASLRRPLPGEEEDVTGQTQLEMFEHDVDELIAKALDERLLIDAPMPPEIRRDSPAEYHYKRDRLANADAMVAKARMLFDLRIASAFVPAIRKDWWSLLRTPDPGAFARKRSWWEEFEACREGQRFFHWELQFPEMFRGPRSGFDAVLGNPPWDKVLPSKLEFYGQHDILIRAYSEGDRDKRIKELHAMHPSLAAGFAAYKEQTTTYARVLRGGDFPLSKGRTQAAHEDLSKYFIERAIQIAGPARNVGMILPSVLYNGDGCVKLRQYLLQEAIIRSFYAFENRQKIFPIDSRYKFVCLVFQKAPPTADGFDVAYMRHDVVELADDSPKPWIVRVTPEEIERLSPETFAFLEYRGPDDQAIAKRMHEGRPTLGGRQEGHWEAEFITDMAHIQIYNSARDKDLWTDPRSGQVYTPAAVLGLTLATLPKAVQQMQRKGFWPVYEGKHIEQFLIGIKPIRWWLNAAQAESKHGRAPRPGQLVVFRETASNTNERTCIAAVLPTKAAASHKLTGLLLDKLPFAAAVTVLNSFCFDYILRMRTAGTSISITFMRCMPVPPIEKVQRLPQVETLDASKAGVAHITEDRNQWASLWRANRAVAEAYGVTADDFAHILATFPVFTRKRPAFFAYLQERVKEWQEEG